MPAKKTTTATNAAVQQGLNVRRGPAKTATKAVTKTSTATSAASKLNGPRKAVKSVAAVKKTTPVAASTVLYKDTDALTTAATAVKKFITTRAKDMFGTDHAALRMKAVREAAPFWAQAKRNITRAGKRIVDRGEWFIALDFGDDSPMGLTTAVIKADGTLIYFVKAEDAKLDSFTYLTA